MPVRLVVAAIPVAVVYLLMGALLIPLEFVLSVVVPPWVTEYADGMILTIAGRVYGSLMWVVPVGVALWQVDRRRDIFPSNLWKWASELMFGLVVGVGIQLLMLGMNLVRGTATITGFALGNAGQHPFVWGGGLLIYTLCIGIREEVIFRGFLLKNLAEGLDSFPWLSQRLTAGFAIVLSSILFTLWHSGRTLEFHAMAFSIGCLFGLAYVLTKSIALPVGLHAGWDLAPVGLVSQQSQPVNTLLQIASTGAGPQTLLGLPVGSLITYVALFVGTLLVLAWVLIRTGSLRISSWVTTPRLNDNHHVEYAFNFLEIIDTDQNKISE